LTDVGRKARNGGMSDLLLVDDDRRIVELVAFFLRKRGHEVRTCANFAEVRAALAQRVPDLVLCDVDLGGEMADEELPKLAEEGILPSTLIVSGYVDAELEGRLMAIGRVVGLVRKPFDFATLEGRVGAAVSEVAKKGVVDEGDGWVEVRSFEAEA
jgi:DNA-binding response OmpR family regulator